MGWTAPRTSPQVVGEAATLAGPTYVATAIDAPGVIKQTGTHRRVVLGEYFNRRSGVSERVRAIEQAMLGADIHAEAVADARMAIWEKFTLSRAVRRVHRRHAAADRADLGRRGLPQRCSSMRSRKSSGVARASGITLPHDQRETIDEYVGEDCRRPRVRHS